MENPIVEIPTVHCLRCGYDWHPRVPNPKKCPHCLSPYWNTERKKEEIVVGKGE